MEIPSVPPLTFRDLGFEGGGDRWSDISWYYTQIFFQLQKKIIDEKNKIVFWKFSKIFRTFQDFKWKMSKSWRKIFDEISISKISSNIFRFFKIFRSFFFQMKKKIFFLELKKIIVYSFDAEKAYLSIGDVSRAIRVA